MRQDELLRLLNSVGKKCFVDFFAEFGDSRLSNAEVVEMLPSEYTLKARQSRVSTARRILREGAAREALEIVAASEKVDISAARRAWKLLDRE